MSAETSRVQLAPDESDGLVRQLHLSTFLRIVVPSKTTQNEFLPLDEWVRTALMIILPHSDGATEVRGIGHWLNGARVLVSEPVAVLDVYLTRALTPASCWSITEQLILMADHMKQEALAVAVEHRLFLLHPPGAVNRTIDSPQRQRFLRRKALEARFPNGSTHLLRPQTTGRR